MILTFMNFGLFVDTFKGISFLHFLPFLCLDYELGCLNFPAILNREEKRGKVQYLLRYS